MPPPTEPAVWSTRFCSQLLTEPVADDPVSVVDRLLAVQAQDPRAMRLAIRSRTTGVVATDVDRALTDDRSLVVTWLNRGTLHLVTATDYWWLHPLTAPRFVTWNRTRLRQEGVTETDEARGVALVTDAVVAGPHTRAELRTIFDDAGIPTGGQALHHLLVAASIEGDVVRGPVVDGDLAYVSASRWLGPPPPPLSTGEALARLGERYLAAHAPAEPADLAKWAGITLIAARHALGQLDPAAASSEQPDDNPPRWPAPRLLGGFDPILHGWADRTGITGGHRDIVTTNGIFRPIGLVDGRAVATWGLAGGSVTINPLEEITPAALGALERDADGVISFFGTTTRPATD